MRRTRISPERPRSGFRCPAQGARGGLWPALLLGALLLTPGCDDFESEPGDHANCEPLGLGCTDCHGDPERGDPAPPVDTQGRSAPSEVTVGAHQAHLGTSDWHAELRCEDCHQVPAAVNAAGHIDGGPAELTWGALATTGDASPSFDRGAATCASVYCHGSTLDAGGSNTAPRWTVVDGSQAACGTCHGLPPASPHPQNPDCADCHGAVVSTDGGFHDPSRHINGQVEVSAFGCNDCHGNADNDAPPVDTEGRSDSSFVTVGAHQPHLTPSDWHRDVQCQDCHVVPDTVDAPGHLDPGPAEVTWGALASAGGASPAFDRTATTCDGVYCHGTTLLGPSTGGTVSRTPLWTTVDGTYDQCGTTCHTLPPGGGHPADDQCQICHGDVISSFNASDPAASTWNQPLLHINGTVD